jgi:cytochrome b involved in lipid metabolism
MASDATNPRNRVKVALKPGFHLMDWVRLNGSLPNSSASRKISPEELAQHNKISDCWTAYNGKVYNITQYIHYHPGGQAKLMLGAGRDCTPLFNRYHKWVNGHAMLSNCLVGTYSDNSISTQEIKNENDLEDDQDQDESIEKIKDNKTNIESTDRNLMLSRESLSSIALAKLDLSDKHEGLDETKGTDSES